MTPSDFFELFKIVAILIVSALSFYLPIKAISKNSGLAAKLSVPVSVSIQILFGYLFYCFAKIQDYPFYYFSIVLVINVITIIRFRPIAKPIKVKANWKILAGIIILVLATVYRFFFDGITNVAPGVIDTANHISFLFKDLKTYGYLSFPTYPPGFHIFIYPLTLISSPISLYRFTGPIIGLITLLSTVLVCKDIFKHRISIVVLVALFLLPIFNQLILQLIGFFPTALSFLFVAFLLVIATEHRISIRTKWLLSLIVLIAMAITIPYLTVQLIPGFVMLLIFSLFNFKKRDRDIHKSIVILTVGLILSFAFAFMHVYLQGSILKRTSGFPAIETAVSSNGSLVVKTTYQQKDSLIQHFPPSIKKIAEHPLVGDYVLPMVVTGADIIKIKNIRELSGTLSIGAYALIAVAIATIIIKRKEINLAIISALVIVFGLSTQTGILEISTYRGRSGYYMLLFSAILVASLVDYYYTSKYHNHLLAITALSVAISFTYPPIYYRDYYPEYFEATQKIINEYSDKSILIKTNKSALSYLSPRIKTENLNGNTELDGCDLDKCFLMLEKKYLYLDPILSQRSYAADEGNRNFDQWQERQAEIQADLTEKIKSDSSFGNFKIYFETDNLEVFEIPKN